MSIWVKICKYVDFIKKKCRKIPILVKIVSILDFDQNCQKNLDFGQNLPKCRFWSKLMKILILVKIFKKCRFDNDNDNDNDNEKIFIAK